MAGTQRRQQGTYILLWREETASSISGICSFTKQTVTSLQPRHGADYIIKLLKRGIPLGMVVAIALAFRGGGKRIISTGLNCPAWDTQDDDGEETWDYIVWGPAKSSLVEILRMIMGQSEEDTIEGTLPLLVRKASHPQLCSGFKKFFWKS